MAQDVASSHRAAAPNSAVALLNITAGPHSGVVLPLDAPTCRIGSSPDSDIVLSDRDVAETHAALKFERGKLFIEAQGGPVGLKDGLEIPQGQGAGVRLPADIRIGASVIRLAGLQKPAPWLQPPMAAVACVALLLVGSIVATQAGFGDAATDARPSNPEAASAVAGAQPDDPVAALRERVASAGVDGVTIEAVGDRIVAKGAIEDVAKPRWAAAQRWFDETYGGQYVLASEIGAKSAQARPRIQLQAIWFGPSPYVVTADGQRRYAGATLGDGWVLKEVRQDKVVVSKAGEEMTLSY
ncbi:SctD/MshK family protein [Chenggangzhangella methanolivorans]|uniref:FHA domain-containing protein n=1 Tax=Chenggangzhangella methanolivorans TaxID=1437009 RepID=A0A9E6UJT5_9HYPH|nr:EscD/YscD/HrpQ family type III secretion system periplasmic domain-containing protein [Chenggangzhangella methanolivorans]QZN98471.1 FHA domain-containing protein [Chenggangzhangella methanolivorans]